MKSAIIPGLGMVADFGLSGANCLLAHVSAITIGKANQKFSDWIFFSYEAVKCGNEQLCPHFEGL
ncbi:hypothetical protein [Lactiplantibacillus paraxiangfangensis]|uniref:hypothetical protein n=1 Tax=Lactiplantibacillus paraxiangfangensis TaxID=3076224 RepID=UPI0030C72C0B